MNRTPPSPRCRALLLELSRYLDGELSPSRRRIVERHIASCTCCGTMEHRLRTVMAACRAEGDEPLPRAVTASAARRIKKLLTPDRKP
ncbi:MAG: zf-HC2 domain-containing protein [Vicinamibacterales bacterium]